MASVNTRRPLAKKIGMGPWQKNMRSKFTLSIQFHITPHAGSSHRPPANICFSFSELCKLQYMDSFCRGNKLIFGGKKSDKSAA